MELLPAISFVAEISRKHFEQPEHLKYAMFPDVVQVGSFAAISIIE
jgi:hypothetical protein